MFTVQGRGRKCEAGLLTRSCDDARVSSVDLQKPLEQRGFGKKSGVSCIGVYMVVSLEWCVSFFILVWLFQISFIYIFLMIRKEGIQFKHGKR